MKSGLMNFCNLNTVLMVVILGLVIYCCVRQSRENFSYGLNYSQLQYEKDENGRCVLVDTGTMDNADPDCYQYIHDLVAEDMRQAAEELTKLLDARDKDCQSNVNSQQCKDAEANLQALIQATRSSTKPAISVNDVKSFFGGEDQLVDLEKRARNTIVKDYLNLEDDALELKNSKNQPLFDSRADLRNKLKSGELPSSTNEATQIQLNQLQEAHNLPEPSSYVAFSSDLTGLPDMNNVSNRTYGTYFN